MSHCESCNTRTLPYDSIDSKARLDPMQLKYNRHSSLPQLGNPLSIFNRYGLLLYDKYTDNRFVPDPVELLKYSVPVIRNARPADALRPSYRIVPGLGYSFEIEPNSMN